MGLNDRRKDLQRQLEELNAEEKNRAWAETKLASFDRQEKERLLRYLKDWRKDQQGHDYDCNCGECD